MGRGHNPGISPKDRLRWLEKLEDGQGITSICKEASRDIRIVKRNIEIAREERQAARVGHDFLLNKLESHQQDLLNEVRRLKVLVVRFPPHRLVPSGPLEKKIYEAFAEHVHRTLLKALLESWEEALVDFETGLGAIKEDVDNREKELKRLLAEKIETPGWSPSIVEALEQGTDSGESMLKKLKHYEHPRVAGLYHPCWGDVRLTRNPVDQSQTNLVIGVHEQLLECSSRHLLYFDQWRERFKEFAEQIIDELDAFILKRMVPSRCKYCPI